MTNVSNKIYPILFADNTTVLIEGNNLDVIITSRNSEFEQINTWLKPNKLSQNVRKHIIWCFTVLEGTSAIINYLLITRWLHKFVVLNN